MQLRCEAEAPLSHSLQCPGEGIQSRHSSCHDTIPLPAVGPELLQLNLPASLQICHFVLHRLSCKKLKTTKPSSCSARHRRRPGFPAWCLCHPQRMAEQHPGSDLIITPSPPAGSDRAPQGTQHSTATKPALSPSRHADLLPACT